MTKLSFPFTEEKIRSVKAGDEVFLTFGILFAEGTEDSHIDRPQIQHGVPKASSRVRGSMKVEIDAVELPAHNTFASYVLDCLPRKRNRHGL